MSELTNRYVACIRTGGVLDLEVGKLYRVAAAESSDPASDLRVIDESGDDYLYPASWFVDVEVPEASARALREANESRSSATG